MNLCSVVPLGQFCHADLHLTKEGRRLFLIPLGNLRSILHLMHEYHLPQRRVVLCHGHIDLGHMLQLLTSLRRRAINHRLKQLRQGIRIGLQNQIIQIGEHMVKHAGGITDALCHLAHTEFLQPVFSHKVPYRLYCQRLQFFTAVLVTTCHSNSLLTRITPLRRFATEGAEETRTPCGSGRSTAKASGPKYRGGITAPTGDSWQALRNVFLGERCVLCGKNQLFNPARISSARRLW